MKVTDLQKGAENVGISLGKAAKIGKKTVDDSLAGALSLAMKAQEGAQSALKMMYNPVFPEQFQKADFFIPNLIMIKDDAVRRNVDVCKGSIGWRSTQNGVEILNLYDEAVEFSGLHFIPAAVCDSVYYVDPFDRSRFIQLGCYFEKMQASRLAELEHIAFSLGAKNYCVEMEESTKENRNFAQEVFGNKSAILHGVKVGEDSSESRTVEDEKSSQRKIVAGSKFESGRQPVRPEDLRWFTHDDQVQNLINMRCSGAGSDGMQTYTIEFKGSDFSTIGITTAAKIDSALGLISFGNSFKLQNKVSKECHSKLYYKLEF